MTVLAFGNWEPDKQNYQGATSKFAQNVVPKADGYGPWKAFTVYSQALPSACRGVFYGRKTDGTIVVFAGVSGLTSAKLFRLDNTTLTWVPVSKGVALVSITNASPAVINTVTPHGQAIGDAVVFTTTGTLPTPLVVGTTYYIITAGFGASTFQIALTPGGIAINTSSAGSGTHSMSGTYSTLPTSDHWQFAQFGNLVIAVQSNTVPQVFDISVDTLFSNLAPGATVPQSRYIAVVNRFVVLSGLTSTPYRIQWSGLNSVNGAASWTSGVNGSDFQDFPDGGVVRGVAGGEYGVVFQDGVIRSMIYAVGSTYIFQFIRIAEDKGLLAPYSIIRSGSNIFFLASQGFHKIIGSTVAPLPIGKDKVDATFFADYDQSALQLIIGASDPQFTRVYWAYKSQAGAVNTFDKIMVFDYVLEQWSIILQNGEFLSTLAAPGATLESLDAISGSLDALTTSLDDFAVAALPKVVCVDTSHRLGFFSGSNVEATIDTAEQAITGKRARVTGLYPVTDAPGVFGAVGYRETLQGTVSYSLEQIVTARGMCHANVSTRLARGRMRIPANTVWTSATGFEPVFVPEGQR